jgi:hypothetical protein
VHHSLAVTGEAGRSDGEGARIDDMFCVGRLPSRTTRKSQRGKFARSWLAATHMPLLARTASPESEIIIHSKRSWPLFWFAMRSASVARMRAFMGNSGCSTKPNRGRRFEAAAMTEFLSTSTASVPENC